MKVYLEVRCDPKPLSRARTSSGRMYYPQNKLDEMNELSWEIARALTHCGVARDELERKIENEPTIAVTMEFLLPMSKSWSQKKKKSMLATAHKQKPDLDNLIKNVLDRGNGILWKDDDSIYYIKASKSWAEKGYIKIEIDYD